MQRRVVPLWTASFCFVFLAQFLLVSSVSVFPDSDLAMLPPWLSKVIVAANAQPVLLGALPAAAVAFFVARLVRTLERKTQAYPMPSKALLASWCGVWLFWWLVVYLWLAGSDVTLWSLAPLAQPVAWLGFVLCALGLQLGANTGEA